IAGKHRSAAVGAGELIASLPADNGVVAAGAGDGEVKLDIGLGGDPVGAGPAVDEEFASGGNEVGDAVERDDGSGKTHAFADEDFIVGGGAGDGAAGPCAGEDG